MSVDTGAQPVLSLAASIDHLVHGSCAPQFLHALHTTLAGGPPPADRSAPAREQHLTGRLRALCGALPPARRLLTDPDRLAALLSWAAISDPTLCMTLITHQTLCLGSMAQLSPHHDELAAEFAALESGRAKGAYLITEAGQANSHLATRTEAVLDPDTREFVLRTPDDAAAKFCGVGARGAPRTVVVLARVLARGRDRGVFSFVVDLSDGHGPLPGVGISSPLELGALPLDYALVRFDGVRLPYERWLRDSAYVAADGSFHDPLPGADDRLRRTLCVGQELWGTLPSVAAATSRQSAVLALRYARQRRTQGRLAPDTPLLSYRSHQDALLGVFAEAFALTCAAARARDLLRAAVGDRDSDRDGDRGSDGAAGAADAGHDAMTFAPWSAVSRPLSAYKAHSVRAASRVTAVCQRLCGFAGHLDANRLAGYHGFHHAFDPAGGDSQLIYYDLGRALAAEADPAAPGAGDRPGTLAVGPADPAWWPTVARAHERRLARQLRRAHDDRAALGAVDFDLWNPLLVRAGELGEVYAARLAAQDVTRALAAVTDPAAREVLTALAALSGVVAARRWAGPLLSESTLRPRDVQALEETAGELCARLLPRLPLLERAFGYPTDLVGAPLATEDYTDALTTSLSWDQGAVT